jgi:branched-chain amino acid transport system ATP-binding protein
MSALLEISNLTVRYGKVEAVANVAIEVGEGRIVTIVGPNGAGKTTLLGAVMGLLQSTGGIRYAGADISKMDVEDRIASGLCLVPEKRELFGDMTVADNLLLGAYLHRNDIRHIRDGLERVYGLFPRLKERRGQIANTLSGGERQMLALGRALMAKPRLLMLDEPSLGLAPLVVREIFRTIASLRDLGVSILLVEQNARAALETADYGYVLEIGQVSLAGPAEDLVGDPRVVATYLGGSS